MKVRAKEPCFVDRLFREAGEAFDWRNARNEPLPACMELVEPEPVTPEEPVAEEKRRPGRPKKQG